MDRLHRAPIDVVSDRRTLGITDGDCLAEPSGGKPE
jgi:hypothetical protein